MASPAMRQARATQEARRTALRLEALVAFGGEDGVWQPGAEETVLVTGCQGMIVEVPIDGGTMETLQGWYGGGYDGLPVAVREALLGAIPIVTVEAAWREFTAWERLYAVREAFWGDYEHPLAIRARMAQLERSLDTLPARSMRGLRARLDWMAHLTEKEWGRGRIDDGRLVAQLRDDVERLGAQLQRKDKTESEEPTGSPSGDKPQENRNR